MPGLAGEKARSEHPATKEFPTSLEKMKADNLRFNAREDREDLPPRVFERSFFRGPDRRTRNMRPPPIAEQRP